jgi:branched-chain amino acid transport system substrate-binding protein
MKKLATLATSVALLASIGVAKEINVGVIMPMSGPVEFSSGDSIPN